MKDSDRFLIQKLVNEQKWTKAKKEILQQMQKSPKDMWLLSRLSNVYFGIGNYKKAIAISERAYTVEPDNPLVLWDYAHALYMGQHTRESLNFYQKILKKKPTIIARTMGWKITKAKEFQNACRFDITHCYLQIDKLYAASMQLKKYIAHSGHYYSLNTAKNLLRCITKLKGQITNKQPRIWISLLEIKKLGNTSRMKYKKGFTNGLVLAKSAKEAISSLSKCLFNMGYRVISAEDTEEFDRRRFKFKVNDELKRLASVVERLGTPQFSDFCMYPLRK
jgi:hypothetical protein